MRVEAWIAKVLEENSWGTSSSLRVAQSSNWQTGLPPVVDFLGAHA